MSLFSVFPSPLRSKYSPTLLAALAAPSPIVLHVAYCCAASPEWLPGLDGLVGRALPRRRWRRCCTFPGPWPRLCSADLAPLPPWRCSSFPVLFALALLWAFAALARVVSRVTFLGLWCFAQPGVHWRAIASPDVSPAVLTASFWSHGGLCCSQRARRPSLLLAAVETWVSP